jgi:hypothetical protein
MSYDPSWDMAIIGILFGVITALLILLGIFWFIKCGSIGNLECTI